MTSIEIPDTEEQEINALLAELESLLEDQPNETEQELDQLLQHLLADDPDQPATPGQLAELDRMTEQLVEEMAGH